MARKLNKLIALILFCILCESALFAKDLTPEQDATAEGIFATVLSPFCPGRLLSDCPSGLASELKEKIRVEISEGKNSDTIIKELYTEFGEDKLRSVPKAEGFGLVGWLAPSFFLILGIIVLGKWFRSTNDIIPLESTPTDDIDPVVAARIERDLNN